MDKKFRKNLELSPKEMKDLGYRVVDMIIDHVTNVRKKSVTRKASRNLMEKKFREPIPKKGSNYKKVLKQLEQDVFPNIMHLDHPRFFAFVPSPSNYVSVIADSLVSGFNVFSGTWLESSSAAQIELVTIDWLRQLCGLPKTAGGLFVSGGSMANLVGLATARHVKLKDNTKKAVIYFSDQAHSSNERGLKILGFSPKQFRKLPSDKDFRLNVAVLKKQVKLDKSKGKKPFLVIASSGTVNTGSIDPLRALANFCRKEGLWLHVDGAYGASAVLSKKGKSLLKGIGLVDSVSLDPHKWLFQPYEMGCILIRDRLDLKDTFHILPEYLKDVDRDAEEINFCDYGIQLTRSFRALKLWMSLKVFGLNSFSKAIDEGFKSAEYTEKVLRKSKLWEVVTPAQMGIITFRYKKPGLTEKELNILNQKLIDKMLEDGFAMVSGTILRGKKVLRFCMINPRTTKKDIEQTIKKFETFAKVLTS